MKDTIRILIVDDHSLVRDGIAAYLQLEESIEVVGFAGNGLEAIERCQGLQPDVVLMDVAMPVMGGLEATASIKKDWPNIKILVLSMHNESEYILQLMQSGAAGYVLKDVSFDELLKAIETVYQGNTYFSSGASEKLFTNFNVSEKEVSPLTERELSVLYHIAEGLCNKEIARKLYISVRTVETHRQNIKRKLNIHTTAGLTKYALEYSLID